MFTSFAGLLQKAFMRPQPLVVGGSGSGVNMVVTLSSSLPPPPQLSRGLVSANPLSRSILNRKGEPHRKSSIFRLVASSIDT